MFLKSKTERLFLQNCLDVKFKKIHLRILYLFYVNNNEQHLYNAYSGLGTLLSIYYHIVKITLKQAPLLSLQMRKLEHQKVRLLAQDSIAKNTYVHVYYTLWRSSFDSFLNIFSFQKITIQKTFISATMSQVLSIHTLMDPVAFWEFTSWWQRLWQQ